MAILTSSGRAAVAASIKAMPLHLAWGAGLPSWDATPEPEPVLATALQSEIGRRELTQALFCVPDANGEVIVPTGRFSISNEPTNNLYLRFNFDFADAASSDIREVGVFVGTVVKSGLPPGQKYFTLAELQQHGQLLALERLPKFSRNAAVRQTFEFVITF
ncbi:hypothetical protein [Pseudoduganella namucuonensis]|uniref:Uncharacterized protein n=1 Tax=Pseudoduganella namucuonensis TaxID=1035707 RepID=A0A1I7J3A7_9BURK|nr:hypothetical protein [Pseudoduganella namucuonensis]SFU79644.1 hypothetical protein SAMN05216552_101023 [Pseudoduganella namucuonensis]